MPRFGLAAKITIPFVVLFAVVLGALGVVLTRELFHDIERQEEGKLAFVLSVAKDENFPLSRNALVRLCQDADSSEVGNAGMDLVVLRSGAGRADRETTLDLKGDPAQQRLFLELLTRIQDPGLFPGLARRPAAGAPAPAPGAGSDGETAASPELKDPEQEIAGLLAGRGPFETAAVPESARAVLHTSITLGGRPYLVHYASGIYRPAPEGKRLESEWREYFLLYPLANVQRVQTRMLDRIIWLGAAGAGLAALLGALVAQRVTRPVRRLAASAGRIAEGQGGEAFEDAAGKTRDEIGELSRALRSMVERLQRLRREQVQAERLAATGRLAASVAHEIRNPLTSLRMAIQMLAAKGGDAATQETCAVVLGEIDRLALAVEELLTFARPRPAVRQPTDLNKLAADTVAFLQRQFEHARVEVRVEPDPALPAEGALDPNKIRQLLVNLLLNALQALVRKGTVVVRTRWLAQERVALLEVADDGPGIPEAIRGEVFNLFVSTKPGGGGLGLAIAKQVVEEHGGTIDFETSGLGTTFRIRLPYALGQA